MKAAVLHALAEPLSVKDLTTPTPGAGEVLVKVMACGVCDSEKKVKSRKKKWANGSRRDV